MSAIASIAPDLFDLTLTALGALSDQQRRVYELTHGLDETGQTDRGEMELQHVADLLEISRGAARWHLAQAERTVYRTIAMHLYAAELERRDAEELPEPGEVVAGAQNQHEVGMWVRYRRENNEATILGPGSERHVREAKRSDAKGRTEALVRAHQECVGVLA